jgi:peroxiredoxin
MNPNIPVGHVLDLGQVYRINDLDIHESYTAGSIFGEGRTVVFGGPAPFSRLDTEQAVAYEHASTAMLTLGVDKIVGLYVQDAFVMKEFQQRVRDLAGTDNVKFYGDGDGFFVRNYGLEFDFTYQGLSVRSWRWAAVVFNGRVEFSAWDDFQLIEKTAAKQVLEFLKNET